MDFKKTELNSLIKEIRLSLGLSQIDFAKKTGLASQSKVSDIENNRVKIGLNLLDKVCNNCGLEYSITIKLENK
jgi:transcriptional regulator with XRE-family HTH domain